MYYIVFCSLRSSVHEALSHVFSFPGLCTAGSLLVCAVTSLLVCVAAHAAHKTQIQVTVEQQTVDSVEQFLRDSIIPVLLWLVGVLITIRVNTNGVTCSQIWCDASMSAYVHW